MDAKTKATTIAGLAGGATDADDWKTAAELAHTKALEVKTQLDKLHEAAVKMAAGTQTTSEFTYRPGCYYGSSTKDTKFTYGMPNAYAKSTANSAVWYGLRIPSADTESTIKDDKGEIAFSGLQV